MPIRPDLRHHYRTPAWFAARKAVRERAGDRCERCNAKNGAYIIRNVENGRAMPGFIVITKRDAAGLKARGLRAIRIQCGCAHVNGVAGDDRDENLRWWCRGCHLRNDAGFHKRTRAERKDRDRGVLDPEAWGRRFEALAKPEAKT